MSTTEQQPDPEAIIKELETRINAREEQATRTHERLGRTDSVVEELKLDACIDSINAEIETLENHIESLENDDKPLDR